MKMMSIALKNAIVVRNITYLIQQKQSVGENIIRQKTMKHKMMQVKLLY